MSPFALLVLLISGGPTPEYNQYAIESNARYVESLTRSAQYQRVHFANGSKTAATIATVEPAPLAREKVAFAWIWDENLPAERTVYRAPTLKRLDGPSTRPAITGAVKAFAQTAQSGQKGLLYFTGHGSPGANALGSLLGLGGEDTQNTLYACWGNQDLSVRELAGLLQPIWPQRAPLVLVMVQCHAGGFANLLFEGGDPQKAVWNRDFCGFFAATGDRQAAGCTSQVDERDYQDFTTHFFAALSGISRDGRPISGADCDQNGTVSLLEAFAWANVRDLSIDVPVCTSDTFLRRVFPASDAAWTKTSYATLLAGAAPWQKAILSGLSAALHLAGDTRLQQAVDAHRQLKAHLAAIEKSREDETPPNVDEAELERRAARLKSELRRRFPGLQAPRRSSKFGAAKLSALNWLHQRPADLEFFNRATRLYEEADGAGEVREAMLWRFLRCARTITLEKRLLERGTAEQKAIFAHLRSAESRNPLK